ncbi:MAG: uroporphyrinogen-III C-methyltransferase [Gammaproteobacteria bacterium]|nr:uroporphyrinogen-III C-methyltransferase [Gammaproteobacteria bacterium]
MGDKKKSQTKNNDTRQAPDKKAVAVQEPVKKESAPAAVAVTPQKSGGNGIALLALVTAVSAAGLGYKGWDESNKLNTLLSDQDGQIEYSINTALKPTIVSVGAVESGLGSVQITVNTLQSEIDRLKSELASLQRELGEVKGGVATLQNTHQNGLGDINANLDEKIQTVQSRHGSLEEQQKSLQDNVNALNEGLSSLKSEVQAEAEKDKMSAWVLAEIEYLLHIANSRLNLEHDVDAALTALNASAKQLAELNLPELADIQQMINSEIEALGNVPNLDIPKMAQTLITLGSNIEQLPLARPKEASLVNSSTASDRKQWEILANEVWTALKPLVTVRNSQDPAMAPFTPEKHTYLTQNLQLKIESARLALLRADNSTFHENLTISSEWLSQFYDVNSTEGASALAILSELQQATIDTNLPDISASLQALQKFIANNSLKVSSPISRSNQILALTPSTSVAIDAAIFTSRGVTTL